MIYDLGIFFESFKMKFCVVLMLVKDIYGYLLEQFKNNFYDIILFDYFKVNVYYKVCLISRVLFFLKNCVMRILYLENKVFVS